MISVTIPIYNEEESIPVLYKQLVATLDNLDRPYEIIFINDGSRDGSPRVLNDLAKSDTNVKVIHFRRNFGQTAAMMAGFDYAQGDIIVPMDGDLQNDPADIPLLLSKLDEGYDVCSGWRKDRKDSAIKRRLMSKAANKVVSLISNVKLHDIGCSMKAYHKDVIKGVKLYGEMHRFIPIYASWEGARITEVPVNHRPRIYGSSSYGLERTFKVIMDLIVIAFLDNYVQKPIYLFGGVGILNFLIAFSSGIASVAFKIWGNKSFIETPLPLLSVMTFVTGTLFILMGLLAEMIMRTYYESQGKRVYIINSMKNMEMQKPAEAVLK